MLFTKEEIKNNVPNICGIYLIRNKENGKCYIGQSIYLRKRLLTHVNPKTWNKAKDKMIIYQAILEIGVEKFEFEILYTNDSTDYGNVKPILDELEKKYIKEFNSKENGYNQTVGGDAGILGFKMTKKQKEHQREARVTYIRKQQPELRAFDTKTLHMFFAITLDELADKIGIKLHRGCYRNLLVANRFIIARSGKELNEKSNLYYETRKNRKNIADEFIEYRRNHTIKECVEHFNVCKKTIENWQNKYCPEFIGKDKFKSSFYIRNKKTCLIFKVKTLAEAERELRDLGYSISASSLARLRDGEVKCSKDFELYQPNEQSR